MTWQDRKAILSIKHIWLALLIVPAFFLLSCGQNDNIDAPGLGAEDNLSAIVVDTFQIQSRTILRDSVLTSGASNLLVGSIESSNFGRITCNSFAQTSLSGNSFIDSENPQFDSMILVLRPSYIFGNPDAVIKMGIYRLKEGFESNTPYYAFSSLDFDRKEPLAEVTFSAQDVQSENLRIDLTEQLGREFFNSRTTEFFQSSADFVDYFKGLAFVTEVAEGSVIGFEVDPASSTVSTLTSGLFFHYRTSEDSVTADTTFYKFPISVNFQRFNQIIHDRPAILSNLKDYNQKISSDLTADEVYLLAGTGIQCELELPTFRNIRNQYRNLIVEQATLVMDVGLEENFYLPPEELFMFKLDSLDQVEGFNGEEVGGAFNNNDVYSFDVTSYFSDLVYDRETISKFLLVPSQNSSTVNQMKFGAFNENNSPIKLLVYYIPIN